MPNAGVILLAEDDPNDVLLFRRAFQRAGFSNHLIVLNDGDDALKYLKGEGQYGERSAFPLPVLLLLDLSMPRLGGLEVLQWVRTQAELKHLPVIILTSSTFAPDLAKAYQAGANSFMSKPGDPAEFSATLKQLLDFWLNTTRLPHPFTPPPSQAPPTISGSAAHPS
jgi:CheY-like chemotaxis protein